MVSGSDAPEDDRFDLAVRVTTGSQGDIKEIAEQLRAWSYQEG